MRVRGARGAAGILAIPGAHPTRTLFDNRRTPKSKLEHVASERPDDGPKAAHKKIVPPVYKAGGEGFAPFLARFPLVGLP